MIIFGNHIKKTYPAPPSYEEVLADFGLKKLEADETMFSVDGVDTFGYGIDGIMLGMELQTLLIDLANPLLRNHEALIFYRTLDDVKAYSNYRDFRFRYDERMYGGSLEEAIRVLMETYNIIDPSLVQYLPLKEELEPIIQEAKSAKYNLFNFVGGEIEKMIGNSTKNLNFSDFDVPPTEKNLTLFDELKSALFALKSEVLSGSPIGWESTNNTPIIGYVSFAGYTGLPPNEVVKEWLEAYERAGWGTGQVLENWEFQSKKLENKYSDKISNIISGYNKQFETKVKEV